MLQSVQETLNSVTGKVETAYLVIKDFRTAAAQMESQAQNAASQAISSFNAQISERTAGAQLSSSALDAIDQARQSAGTSAAANYRATASLQPQEKTFRVQFNPSEIQIYSTSLSSTAVESNATKTGPQSVANATGKPKVEMTVTLYFDAMNIYDSFMWDKFTSGVSAQSITNIATAVSKGKGKAWSVQPQEEGLVSALRNRHTRTICFHWADFSFEGQLSAIMAQYTMFSTSGRPVRAQVTLRLRQELDPENLSGWYNDFKEAFGGSASKQTSSLGQSFGSLLNIGF